MPWARLGNDAIHQPIRIHHSLRIRLSDIEPDEMTWRLRIEVQRTWKVGDCPVLCTRAEGNSSVARDTCQRLSGSRISHGSQVESSSLA